MSQVIDTTQMYLRTVYELLEEGVPPLRARIAERMQHSGPTVSQTVSRMERDGLLTVHDDRRILLSQEGLALATQVMRRHRLAERLLVDVVGLDWADAHDEACKWEHVIGDKVEDRLIVMLDDPQESPYGGPIPRRGDSGEASIERFRCDAIPLLDDALLLDRGKVQLLRIGEYLQRDQDVLHALWEVGVVPGVWMDITWDMPWITLSTERGLCTLDAEWAHHLFAKIAV